MEPAQRRPLSTGVRRAVAVCVLIAAGLAAAATSPAPVSVESKKSFVADVSSASPATAYRLNVAVDHGDGEPTDVLISAGPADGQSGFVSIVSADPAEALRLSESWGYYEGAGPTYDVLDVCQAGCARDYFAVVSARDYGADRRPQMEALVASKYPSSGGGLFANDPLPAGASASLQVDEATTRAAGLRSFIMGRFDVGTEKPAFTWHGKLLVSAPALPDGALLAGGLWSTFDTATSISYALADVSVDFASTRPHGVVGRSFPSVWLRQDWVARCTRTTDCSLPITVVGNWSPPEGARVVATDHLELSFILDVRLSFVNATAPPAGASIDLVAD